MNSFKKLTTLLIGLSFAFISGCATTVIPELFQPNQVGYPPAGTYQVVGRIGITVDVKQSSQLSKGIYELLLDKAKSMGGDDIINIYVDHNNHYQDSLFGTSLTKVEVNASGLAIKYTNKVR